jgi:hypothetical protein
MELLIDQKTQNILIGPRKAGELEKRVKMR